MTQPIGYAQLDIGRVISRTFAAIGANFLTFAILALLFAAVPAVIVGYVVQTYVFPAVMQDVDPRAYALMSNLIEIGTGIVLMLPTYVLIGALTHGTIVYLNGNRASLAECLGTGFTRSLPLLALGLLSTIGTFLFALLFIIPGIMAAIRWCAAAPSLVVERKGVFEAFSRSGDLTRDNRWRIFWLAVIWAIAAYLIQMGVTAGLGFLISSADSLGPYLIWAYLGVSGLYTGISSMIGAAGTASIYSELRTIKEGATTEELAKVFE